MQLYIDGDALPNLLKPILLKAIEKYNLTTYIVSNKKISIGKTNLNCIYYLIVEAGADKADNKIVDMLQSGDLVITADIPLADKTISKDSYAIDHRGETYTKDNIKQYLAMRNLMGTIRDSGEVTKGPKPFSTKDGEYFANSLNKILQAHLN